MVSTMMIMAGHRVTMVGVMGPTLVVLVAIREAEATKRVEVAIVVETLIMAMEAMVVEDIRVTSPSMPVPSKVMGAMVPNLGMVWVMVLITSVVVMVVQEAWTHMELCKVVALDMVVSPPIRMMETKSTVERASPRVSLVVGLEAVLEACNSSRVGLVDHRDALPSSRVALVGSSLLACREASLEFRMPLVVLALAGLVKTGVPVGREARGTLFLAESLTMDIMLKTKGVLRTCFKAQGSSTLWANIIEQAGLGIQGWDHTPLPCFV